MVVGFVRELPVELILGSSKELRCTLANPIVMLLNLDRSITVRIPSETGSEIKRAYLAIAVDKNPTQDSLLLPLGS